jgi:hypothetical protein
VALSNLSNSSSSSSAGQRRRAFTNLERQAIRKRNREHPPANQSELITWFQQETGHKLNQSQISKIISKQFEQHLDSADTKKDKSQLEAKRMSAGDWPFKLQYRRLWVAYMLPQYEAGSDPNKTVTLLKAIQWTRVAWNNIVTTATIQKCWEKSTLVKKTVGQEIVEDNQQADRDELQAQIQELPGITDCLSINEFIQPAGEIAIDEDQDIFASVVERYSIEQEGTVEEVEEGGIEIEKILTAEALKALETVRLWEMQQEDGQATTLQVLVF